MTLLAIETLFDTEYIEVPNSIVSKLGEQKVETKIRVNWQDGLPKGRQHISNLTNQENGKTTLRGTPGGAEELPGVFGTESTKTTEQKGEEITLQDQVQEEGDGKLPGLLQDVDSEMTQIPSIQSELSEAQTVC